MTRSDPRSTVTLCGLPVHAMLLPFPVVCFIGALGTDVAYWRTGSMLWADFSAWLLLVGVAVSILAMAVALIDFIGEPRIRSLRAAWMHLLGSGAVLILSTINALVHTRDAYTSVVPSGLLLSALVVVILLVTTWNGWTMVYRHGVGVRKQEPA
jgi:uncharacterized membrane protein